MALSPPLDLRTLFDQALELPPIARAELLREVQFKSPLLYSQLRELLLAHEGSHEFFEQFEKDGGLWAHFTPPSMIGRRFGSYVIESEIGRGGMGAVYKASRADDVFYKTVAIKTISGGAALSESALEAFRRERQILAQLDHPHIARLLDAGATEDGLLYLIMEYVDGLALDAYIEKHKLNVEGILRLFLDVCDAVAFAHRNLVIHRDLKPSNILVDNTGQVKLLDFGIAKVLQPGRAVTATVALRLTPEFASPEHIRGHGVSTVSDVYSLGVVLFHLLTAGARPYRTTSQAVPDLLQAVLESDTPRPSSVAPQPWSKKISGDLDNIILKAMAKEPARRYASVDQLAEDLSRHLSGRPVIARPATIRYRFGKFIDRNRLGVAAAALLLVAISAGILTTLQQARIAQQERLRAERERSAAVEAQARAETQQRIALQSQANETQQRKLAELRSVEANLERGKAESRYRNVRSLATAILTDVNDALRDLPGSGPARRQAVMTALKHLEDLSAKSAGDLALKEDLANAYEQTGDMLRSISPETPEAPLMAIPALEKAHILRREIAATQPTSQTALANLASGLRLLGNGYMSSGQVPRAITMYRESLRGAERLSSSSDSRELQALAHSNLCAAHLAIKESSHAISHCRSALSFLEAMDPFGALLRTSRLRYASALIQTGDSTGAAKVLQSTLDSLDPSAPDCREAVQQVLQLLAPLPNARPLSSQGQRLLAVSFARGGSRDQALEHYEQSLRLLGVETPTMRQVLSYANFSERLAEGRLLNRQGQARRAIELLSKTLEQVPKNPEDPASLLRAEFEAALNTAELTLAQPAR
jgi:tetratricopeptide (TPR) repeat protein